MGTLQDGYLAIWATGLGAVISSGPFQIIRIIPVVRVGGLESRVLYSGLAPGWLGLYQVNVELPSNHALLRPVEFCFGSYCQPAGWNCGSEFRGGEPAAESPAIHSGSAADRTCGRFLKGIVALSMQE